MPAKRVPFDEQLELIMECRSSGLSDHQWCLEHDINPGTFYNWVKRHKQAACGNLPAPAGKQQVSHHQDIVRIDPGSIRQTPDGPVSITGSAQPAAMELLIDGMMLRITNDVSPGLLAQTLHILKGMTC